MRRVNRDLDQLWLRTMGCVHGLLKFALLQLAMLLPLATSTPTEVEVMHQLRQALYTNQPEWAAEFDSWRLDNPAHPCSWQNVDCDSQQHITSIFLMSTSVGSGPEHFGGRSRHPAPLLPQLASLACLESLVLSGGLAEFELASSIPADWGLPGAFPRLKYLRIVARNISGGLPDIHPGALPVLEMLVIHCQELHATLPASWGASPAVLPALTGLQVDQVVGWLPPQWAHGFVHLEYLSVEIGRRTPSGQHTNLEQGVLASTTRHGSATKAPQPLTAQLPVEWASGFPRLASLILLGQDLTGDIPATWLLPGSFPALTHLWIEDTRVSGNLPEQLFAVHPGITKLQLPGNRFNGSLPGSWGESKVKLLDISDNLLTGPAFPPDWLRPGAMQHLETFGVAFNPGLTGSLPTSLEWPKLNSLQIQATAVSGSMPSSWCTAPVAHHLYINMPEDIAVPPCAAGSLPHLDVVSNTNSTLDTASGAAGTLDLMLLLSGLLLAGCAAGGMLWLRQLSRRRHPSGQAQQHRFRLLQDGSSSGRSASASASSSAATSGLQELVALSGTGEAGEPGPAVPGLGLGLEESAAIHRRRRLSALVAGAEGGPGLNLLPMQSMPTAVAHRLRSLVASRRRASRRGGEDVPSMSQPHSSVAVGEGRQQAAIAAGVGGAAGAEQDRLLPKQVHFSNSLAGDRRWGLETDSLCLPPGELQFARGADGHLLVLGQGSYGVVFQATLPGLEVAVKAFELLPSMDSGVIWSEASLLHQCAHERIVPLYGLALKGSLVLMAMKLMKGGSLHAALRNHATKQELHWNARGRQVALDVAEGLDYLHTQLRLLHSDLKPSNVLLTEDWRAALADLGVAQVMASTAKPAAGGTQLYAAPEQLLGQRCTLAADMYSFGLLLTELLTQRPCQKRGMWSLPKAPHDCPQVVVDLIEACISPEPSQRPSAAWALQQIRAAAAGAVYT